MAAQKITVDEWEAELQRVMVGRDDDGMSSRELADAWQVSLRTAGERIRCLAEHGRIVVGFRSLPSIVPGRNKTVPVYRIKSTQ